MKTVVVGSGAMGAWTALWLRRRGHEVTLVDRFGPGNNLGSSGDESRITRSSHGPDSHYPRWQRQALAQWRELERATDTQLFEPSGVVWLAGEGETFEENSLRVLTELGIPVERWSHDDFARRVPQMRADGVPWALYEPEGGVLLARTGVVATIEAFRAEGGTVVVDRVVAPVAEGGDSLGSIRLESGRALEADAFAFTCGPWLPDLFPDSIGGLITPHRQDVMHFAVPRDGRDYSSPAMPTWIDFGGSFYGFPSLNGQSMKACPDWLGPNERCDDSERACADASIDGARQVLRRRFPALADQPVVRTWTCFYEVTPDANFVIDRHPRLADTWIAGGGTGHAFKHGPVIGEYLSARVSGDGAAAAALAPLDERFAIRPRTASPSFRTSGRNPLEAAPA